MWEKGNATQAEKKFTKKLGARRSKDATGTVGGGVGASGRQNEAFCPYPSYQTSASDLSRIAIAQQQGTCRVGKHGSPHRVAFPAHLIASRHDLQKLSPEKEGMCAHACMHATLFFFAAEGGPRL